MQKFITVYILLAILFLIVEVLFCLSLNRFWRKSRKPKGYVYCTIAISIISYLAFLTFNFLRVKYPLISYFTLGYNTISVLMFPKLILFPFLLIGNLIQLSKNFKSKKVSNDNEERQVEAFSSERRKFIATTGLALGTLPFMASIWGNIYNINSLKKRTVNLSFSKFPELLNGFRIVHISDLHFGSFSSTKQFKRLCSLINYELKPDLLFITGDFVNFSSQELLPYLDDLNNLFSRYGKFAVFGNHDHYVNIDEVKELLAKTDIKLLNNECFNLNTQVTTFQIVGIDYIEENTAIYNSYTKQAFANIDENKMCFFLCHDPVVWDEHIVGKYPADIAFAGHTHGGQIAMPFSDGRITPEKIFHKRVAGLYRSSQQYLYVNTGFGTTSLNIRIGLMPEITIFNLNHANNLVSL